MAGSRGCSAAEDLANLLDFRAGRALVRNRRFYIRQSRIPMDANVLPGTFPGLDCRRVRPQMNRLFRNGLGRIGWSRGSRCRAVVCGVSCCPATASLVLIRACSLLPPCLGGSAVAEVSGGDSASGKSAKETGSASGPRSLPLRFFFSSFSMPRSARRAPLQAVSSIRSPP